MLIALFERAVGFYASLINVNAYHQPGVEAGKKAAGDSQNPKSGHQPPRGLSGGANVAQIAKAIGHDDEVESVFKICEHLAAESGRGIRKSPGPRGSRRNTR